MNIDVYCCNCKEYILQADTETLKSPLVGDMFKQKTGMEWDMFSTSATGNDLTCPKCEWVFHNNGLIRTVMGEVPFQDIFQERPEELIETLKCYIPRKRKVVLPPASVKSDPPASIDIPDKLVESVETGSNGVDTVDDIQVAVEGVTQVNVNTEAPAMNTSGVFTPNAEENAEAEGVAPPGTVAVATQTPLEKKQDALKKKIKNRRKRGRPSKK